MDKKKLDIILEGSSLSKIYHTKSGDIEALKPLNFSLGQSEILGIIGESGSGKSTLLKLLTGLEKPSTGEILLNGKPMSHQRKKGRFEMYQNMQMIFQNPKASFNPRRKIKTSILENMKRLRPHMTQKSCETELEALVEKVGLEARLLEQYPQNLSGGQCQRFAIARALAVKPKILLCDEITSALDVLVQEQVIGLLMALSRSMGLSLIFVSHNIALSSTFCDSLMVMKNGICVEAGSTQEVIQGPNNSYTKHLLSFCSSGQKGEKLLQRGIRGA